jgi:DNA-binding CsgD family transcriptional regulator
VDARAESGVAPVPGQRDQSRVTSAAPGVGPVVESFGGPQRPPRVSIRRLRLEAELASASSKPLTVLVAPAGSGKTTALALWAQSRGEGIRWLTARPGASGTALATALLDCSGVGNPDPATDDSASFVEQLAAGSRAPDLLVVDDAENLPRASWQLLNAAVSQARDHVRVVVATRRDPPVARVDLELSEALTVLRADMLRFDDDEAHQLIAAHAPDATMEDVVALQARANGWAAALVLAARSLASAPDRVTARAGITQTDQPVLDYLLGEVLATMPAGRRHVLLCTADETVVSADLAVMLSGDPDAPERLNELAAEGLLVTALDIGSGVGWTYHPLLRALLRRQVSLGGPDHSLAVAAHRRAARYYARNGPADAALRHAVAANEYGLIRALLVGCGPSLMTTGHEDLLWKALGAIGDEPAIQEPALLGVTALLLAVGGDREQSVRVATLAARAARATRDRAGAAATSGRSPSEAEGALLADSATLNAWLARLGWHDAGDAVDGARAVLGEPLLNSSVPWSPVAVDDLEPARVSWLQSELGLLELWTDNPHEAVRHTDAALVSAEAVGNRRLSAVALSARAMEQLLAGQSQTAASTARHCLRAAAESARPDDGTLARAHLALAWAAFLELRHRDIEPSLAVMRQTDAHSYSPLVAVLRQVLEAWIVARGGDIAMARQLLATELPGPHPHPAVLDGVMAGSRANLALADHAHDEASLHSRALHELGWDLSASVVEAVLLDRHGDPEAALAQLARLRLSTPASVEAASAVYGCVYQAQLHLRADSSAAALDAMRDALTLAAPQRLLVPFVAAGEDGAHERLLEQLSSGAHSHPFAGFVLGRLRDSDRPLTDRDQAAATGPPSSGSHRPVLDDDDEPIIYLRGLAGAVPDRRTTTPAPLPPLPLTGREAEVLRELALGGSYRDVAKVLYVTENTVKTHVSALYRKLGVERRADALRRAREYGLI